MVHKVPKVSYDLNVPCDQNIEMITVSHPDAELLKVFLLKHEKAAFKKLAAEMEYPMYHLVRKIILQLIEKNKGTQANG